MADQNIVPFAEGAPADDLMVEEIADGNVLIGDPELDMMDALEDGIIHIPTDEVHGLISNIDEEISN